MEEQHPPYSQQIANEDWERTLRSQQRNVLEYMTMACHAARAGQSAPSLLPEVTTSQEQILPAA